MMENICGLFVRSGLFPGSFIKEVLTVFKKNECSFGWTISAYEWEKMRLSLDFEALTGVCYSQKRAFAYLYENTAPEAQDTRPAWNTAAQIKNDIAALVEQKHLELKDKNENGFLMVEADLVAARDRAKIRHVEEIACRIKNIIDALSLLNKIRMDSRRGRAQYPAGSRGIRDTTLPGPLTNTSIAVV